MTQPNLPLQVHGLDLSYFTGKLEVYLRNKGIAYNLIEMDTGDFKRCGKATGVAQMPQVEWTNNQWLSDTTLIIPFLEQQFADTSITLAEPAMNFIAQLFEDFGDEWLWRPALYYRWAKARDARLMSDRLASGMMRDIPAPHFVRRWVILNRQRLHFLYRDGYTRKTAPRIEAHYLESLDALNTVLSKQPFVLGARPTLADYGFFGSMFRHFFCDPTPAGIMRVRAPAVHEWVARMWNLKLEEFKDQAMPSAIDDCLSGLFALVVQDFLPYMQANEISWLEGKKNCEFESQGVPFNVPVNPYRVWRYQRMRNRFAQLEKGTQQKVLACLPKLSSFLAEPIAKAIEPKVGSLPILDRSTYKSVGRQWQ